jgi:sucrose phosphorylase
MCPANHDPDRLRAHLSFLYPDADLPFWMSRFSALLQEYAANIPPANDVGLSETSQLLITYGDMVQDDREPHLRTLHRFLKAYAADVISLVHLLPFYPYTSDDGFSVVDYLQVRADLGDWGDVEALSHDFNLAFDAVFNHISSQSQWFQNYLAGAEAVQGFFWDVDPREDLSQVIRPRQHPLLTPYDSSTGRRYIWTTFSADQIDLNFSDPQLLWELTRILLEYLARGATVIRLDAIAFMWKEIGTTCLHLPQTHEIIKLFRTVTDAVAPHVVLLTETNVPHRENVAYFGNGRDEAHMVYQFPLPPLTAHALIRGTGTYLTAWAAALDEPDATNTYLNFLASHDGVGIRPATDLLPPEEVALLVQAAQAHGGRVSYKDNGDGTQSPYELNINYYDLVSGHLPDAEGLDSFLCAHSILMAMPGVPALYFHSLFGSRGDPEGVERTGHNRTINREKVTWDRITRELDEPHHLRAQIYQNLTAMLRLRRSHVAFHPKSGFRIHHWGDDLFVIERGIHTTSPLLAVHNVSADPQSLPHLPQGEWLDLRRHHTLSASDIHLPPRTFVWLQRV